MSAVIMSNPLHLAVLGNPRRKTKKSKRNPQKRKPAYWAKSRKTYQQAKRRARSRAGSLVWMAGNTGLVKVNKVTVRRKPGKKVSPKRKGTKKKAIAWAGKRGTVSYRGVNRRTGNKYTWTNPKGKTMAKRRRSTKRRSVSRRRNPAMSLKGYTRGLTSSPAEIMNLFKGKNKAKNIAFTAGGTLGTYLLGGIIAKHASPILAKVPVLGSNLSNPMVQRVTGALFPYTAGFLASAVVGKKNKKLGQALHLGGAVAAIVELAMPGMLGQWTARIPGLNKAAEVTAEAAGAPAAEAGPVEGLAGYFGSYVDAPSYSGVGGYVDAPSYAGVGGYVDAPSYAGVGDDASILAGYVDTPSYAGVGDDAAVLAGDSDMLAGSFLESNYMDSFLA